ncbi:MAG: hypothetical protein ACLR23_06700 [Clostridia bacterium]
MHAGVAKNDSRQRAHGNIFSAATGETILPAEIQNDKCTPAWRRTTAASGHTETYSPPPPAKTILPAEIQNEKCTPAR